MTSGNPHRNRRNGDIIRTMILHLHLVRHGQTYFNRYNRLQGWSNSPLTESGVADAVKAGERLKGLTFAAAYCSDTTRAQQTAEKILDINEADPFHDAESDEEYWTRVEGAFRLIADNPNLKDGDDVLQISHGNTLLSLGHRFGGPDLDLNERPANGSVTVIDFDTDKPFGEAVTIVSYGK